MDEKIEAGQDDLAALIRSLSTLRVNDSAEPESIPILRINAPGPVVLLTAELYDFVKQTSGRHTVEPIHVEGTLKGHDS
jgi:hypothetical protein